MPLPTVFTAGPLSTTDNAGMTSGKPASSLGPIKTGRVLESMPYNTFTQKSFVGTNLRFISINTRVFGAPAPFNFQTPPRTNGRPI